MARLRCLDAPAHTLAHSLAVLDTASNLEHLGIAQHLPVDYATQSLATALQWAARHPPLCTLGIEADHSVLGGLFFDVLSALQRRPGLAVAEMPLSVPFHLCKLCVGPEPGLGASLADSLPEGPS